MGIAKQGLRPSAQMQQAQAQPPAPPPAPWTTKWQDSCWKRWNTGSSCWCNTCTMEWFCNCGRTVSMVKVVCEMPRTKSLAWRCLLKPLLFSVLIQFMQKEVHYLRVLGWFSKNEGGAISPGSGAIFKEWRRCNISWFWGGRKKEIREHMFSPEVLVYRPGFQLSVPQYAWGGQPGANSNAHMQRAQQQSWQKNRGLLSSKYYLVLGWFSKNEGGAISPGFVVILQNEGLVVRRPYQSTKEAAPN